MEDINIKLNILSLYFFFFKKWNIIIVPKILPEINKKRLVESFIISD